MDQNKNRGQQNWNQGNNPNRDQAEGSRDRQNMPGDQHQGSTRNNQERGRGHSQGERNRSSEGGSSRSNMTGSGISNRGMDRELSEQEELPERGTRDRDRSDL